VEAAQDFPQEGKSAGEQVSAFVVNVA